MRRIVTLAAAGLLALLVVAGPAVAQDNGFEGPYVEPGEVEPTPVPRVEPQPVEREVVPVVHRPAPVTRALPVTGLDLTVGALLAGGLLLAGGGAIMVARRKAAAHA